MKETKRLKNYKDSLTMHLLNILLEWMIIVLAYFVSAALRRFTPLFMARQFAFSDAVSFSVIAYVSAAMNVAIYFIFGDYRTIHFRKLTSEAGRVMLVQLVSGYLISALLFWMKGGQFSRMWLILYVAVCWAMVMFKRIAFHYLSDRFFGKYLKKTRLIVLGGGGLARRYIEGSANLKGNRVEVVGYLSERENPEIPGYLGDESRLKEMISGKELSEVVIARGDISRNELKGILTVCHAANVSVFIIPMFNDFLMSGLRPVFREDIPGLCLFPIDIMRTEDVLGVNIAVTNMDQTIETITENLEKWKGEYICVSNVHTTVMAHDDENYRNIQNGAVMALPDGGPLSTYSRSNGNNTAMRVTGPDLMHEVLKKSPETGWRHFFYGSDKKTLKRLESKIKRDYQGTKVCGMISPPYRALTEKEDEAYVRQINESKPDFVWVGLGAPKQEIWMAEHRGRIKALMIGVGAAFDYESGNIKRAPQWMQRANLEWLYRLMQEPGRLAKRYLFTNFKFLWLTRK